MPTTRNVLIYNDTHRYRGETITYRLEITTCSVAEHHSSVIKPAHLLDDITSTTSLPCDIIATVLLKQHTPTPKVNECRCPCLTLLTIFSKFISENIFA